MLLRRLAAIVVLLVPLAAHAQASQSDAQKLMQKAESGQPLTPAEQARLQADMMKRQQQTMQRQLGKMPPKIQALMQKAQSGQPLTPAERAEIRSWAMKRAMQRMGGGQPGGPPHEGPATSTGGHGGAAHASGGARAINFLAELDAATPHAKAGVGLARRHRLTRRGYLRIVRELRATAAKVIGARTARAIDSAVRHKPKKANELGGLLALSGRTLAASAYAFSDAALASSRSALIASNVGVTLYDANAFKASYDVLGYADVLHPKSGVILSNRAYAAMYLGDLAIASRLFQQAIAAAPKLPNPRVGRAFVARARGDKGKMIAAAGKAIARGSASLMAQAMEASVHMHESNKQRARDTPIAEMTGSVGGIVINLHGHGSLTYPDWTIPADFVGAIEMSPELDQIAHAEVKDLHKLAKKRKAVDEHYAQVQAARAAAMHGNRIMRLNPRILEVLTDLGDVYDARNQIVLRKWQKTLQKFSDAAFTAYSRLQDEYDHAMEACGQSKPCQQSVQYEYCRKFQDQGKEFHASMGAAWGRTDLAQRHLMDRYFKEGDPYINGISDPLLQRVYQLNRVFMFRTFLVSARLGVARWLVRESEFGGPKCIPPQIPKPLPKYENQGKPKKPKKHKPGSCVPPPGQFGLGVMTVSWNCNSFTLQGGEGLVLGVTVAFNGVNGKKTLSGHTETTVKLGVGDTASLGGFSASESAMVSVTAAQGKLVDAGAQLSASLSASAGIASVSAGGTASCSLRSGPNLQPTLSATLGGERGQLDFSN